MFSKKVFVFIFPLLFFPITFAGLDTFLAVHLWGNVIQSVISKGNGCDLDSVAAQMCNYTTVCLAMKIHFK